MVHVMTLTLEGSETWGERFLRAYKKARSHPEFPPGSITYDAIAERVSQLVPTTGTSILRLGSADVEPSRPNQRQIAYLALVAMGFDPREFGLSHSDRRLRGLTDRAIHQTLNPAEHLTQ